MALCNMQLSSTGSGIYALYQYNTLADDALAKESDFAIAQEQDIRCLHDLILASVQPTTLLDVDITIPYSTKHQAVTRGQQAREYKYNLVYIECTYRGGI